MLYVLMLEEREYMRDLATAQLMIDKDHGMKKFNEYQKKRFPWTETATNRDKDMYKQILLDELKKGPLLVRPMGNNKVKSRLISKATKTDGKSNELYKKLGKGIPI